MRGLRQDDSISPYLFAFCLNMLSQIINCAIQNKELTLFRFTRQGPSICHISFTKDFVFFGKTMVDNVNTL